MSIADDTSRLANIDLNYWFYGCSALSRFPTWRTCAAWSMRTTTLSSMPYTLDARTSSTRILVDAGREPPKGHIGSTTFNNHKAIMGGNDTVCDSKQTSTRYAATTARGRRAS